MTWHSDLALIVLDTTDILGKLLSIVRLFKYIIATAITTRAFAVKLSEWSKSIVVNYLDFLSCSKICDIIIIIKYS